MIRMIRNLRAAPVLVIIAMALFTVLSVLVGIGGHPIEALAIGTLGWIVLGGYKLYERYLSSHWKVPRNTIIWKSRIHNLPMKPNHGAYLVDARAKQQKHPHTFSYPYWLVWLAIEFRLFKEVYVKVCISNEVRFWGRVVQIDHMDFEPNILIQLESQLGQSFHGINDGDFLYIWKENIYDLDLIPIHKSKKKQAC